MSINWSLLQYLLLVVWNPIHRHFPVARILAIVMLAGHQEQLEGRSLNIGLLATVAKRTALTRVLQAGVILVICLGASLHVSAAEAPASAFGVYVGAGCPKPAAPTCLASSSHDRVRISRGEGANATASVRLIFDRGHTCELVGEAVWTNEFFMLRADGLDPDKPCDLVLRVDRSVITLEDPGGRCREVYCGTRGAFEGTRFKKVKEFP